MRLLLHHRVNSLMFLKNRFAPFFLSLILICFITPDTHSQKLIQDSLLLNFETDLSKTIPFPIKIDTVFNFRHILLLPTCPSFLQQSKWNKINRPEYQ